MGLDTSHDCWHGSYGSFKWFRDQVAEAALEHYGYKPDYDAHPSRAFMGWWDFPHDEYRRPTDDHHSYDDPLDVFFVHSDCDGWIFPHDAGVLADRLEPLVGYLDDGSIRSARDLLRQFIAGLRKAHEYGEIVAFQ